jgi:hypothetical protein
MLFYRVTPGDAAVRVYGTVLLCSAVCSHHLAACLARVPRISDNYNLKGKHKGTMKSSSVMWPLDRNRKPARPGLIGLMVNPILRGGRQMMARVTPNAHTTLLSLPPSSKD